MAGAVFALGAAAAPDEEPVEPEEAFPLTVATAGLDTLLLHFAIRDGYYLYAERFRVVAEDLAPGTVQALDAIEKEDAFVGRTKIVKGTARVVVSLRQPATPGEYTVRVTVQGCAEHRVCYAPFTQSVKVRFP